MCVPWTSNEVSQELCGAGVPITLDGAIGGLLAEFRDDGRSDLLGGGLRVIHAAARRVAGETVAHMDVLLKMVLQRKLEEGDAGRRQLLAGGEPALHDSQVAGGEMP